ncbi:response regulator transcription factor [Membranihabitans marinus]|uniref:response regulator transcription factor n=1 Tax=Membranihabitans marinus TaxID=1227546 RepID=UPI001F47CF02|nr:response regulator transcription factor [Membranihabitans marinus]
MSNYKPSILIVDDEEDILEFISYNLEKENFQVFTANNGRDALKTANVEKPDLIILDIMMPEMDGVEVCKLLRQDERFNETIIAFLTARGEDYIHTSSLDVGGDDFINKPIKPSVLVSRINALLRRTSKFKASTEAPAHIILGDLELDEESFLVKKLGEELELPRKEFQILALLMSKPGKVFSRDVIFRKIWGADVIVGNRTIDVHIRKLREKIGEQYIKTVKGIGYKFDF